MSESKLATIPYSYGTIVEVDNGIHFSIQMWHPILKNELITQSFAYVMIIEPDDAIREAILRTVTAPNCAVDVARDEDDAVAKAVQHRPQLIIVKQHEPLDIPRLKLPFFQHRQSHLSPCEAKPSSKVGDTFRCCDPI